MFLDSTERELRGPVTLRGENFEIPWLYSERTSRSLDSRGQELRGPLTLREENFNVPWLRGFLTIKKENFKVPCLESMWGRKERVNVLQQKFGRAQMWQLSLLKRDTFKVYKYYTCKVTEIESLMWERNWLNIDPPFHGLQTVLEIVDHELVQELIRLISQMRT